MKARLAVLLSLSFFAAAPAFASPCLVAILLQGIPVSSSVRAEVHFGGEGVQLKTSAPLQLSIANTLVTVRDGMQTPQVGAIISLDGVDYRQEIAWKMKSGPGVEEHDLMRVLWTPVDSNSKRLPMVGFIHEEFPGEGGVTATPLSTYSYALVTVAAWDEPASTSRLQSALDRSQLDAFGDVRY